MEECVLIETSIRSEIRGLSCLGCDAVNMCVKTSCAEREGE